LALPDFQVKNLKTKKVSSYITKNGSLCILNWKTNSECKHAIKKSTSKVGERISLTFRSIKTTRTHEDNEKAKERMNKE
jgi:hypothetical protein